MATNAVLTGGISNAPQGTMEEQDKDKLRYTSDNIKLFFDTVTDDTVSLQSQITDNYLENNTAIQDHIALNPIIVTLHGLCGEKVYTVEEALQNEEKVIAYYNQTNYMREIELRGKKLGAIEAYIPQFSNATALAHNIYEFARASVQKALTVVGTYKSSFQIDSAFNSYNGLDSNIRESKIKKMATYLKEAWLARKPYVVNTPFGVFGNMYIQSVNFHQGNENHICELDVTLKQLRFSDIETTGADQAMLSKYNAMQQAQEQNYGQAKGLKSQAAKIFDGEASF